MMIDFHTHVYPEKIAEKGVRHTLDFYQIGEYTDGSGTIDHLNRCCDQDGILHRVLLGVATRADLVESVNNFLLNLKDEQSSIFGAMHQDFENPEVELSRIQQAGAIGVKIHPDMQECNIDDQRFYPVYRYASTHNMPVLLHLGDPRFDYSNPLRLVRIMDEFPDLVVVAPHFGGYCHWESALDCLCGRNVYLDTSSSIPFGDADIFKKIIQKHGIDRILFGSDYPLETPANALQQLKSLGLDDAQIHQITWENGKRFLQQYGVKL